MWGNNHSSGILTWGKLTINNTTLNIQGEQYGIYGYSGSGITINGGTISATGKYVGINTSYGHLTVSGDASVTGSASSSDSYGISAYELTVNDNASVIGTASGNGSYGISKYYFSDSTLTVNDNATVIAIGIENAKALSYSNIFYNNHHVIAGDSEFNAVLVASPDETTWELPYVKLFPITEVPVTTYTITAIAGEGGTISPSGNVTVNHGDSQTFTITPNSKYAIEDVKVDNVSQGKITSYTFNDVDTNHTISATFRYIGSKGSGGGGSSSVNYNVVTVTPPSSDNPNSPTQGETKVSGTTDYKGNVTVSLTNNMVTEIFDKALQVAKKNDQENNGISMLTYVGTGNKAASTITVYLPKTVLEGIIEKNILHTIVEVENPNIKIDMDLATIQEMYNQAKSDVKILISRVDNNQLSTDAKNAIGNRPTFDFNVNYGQGKQIQNFGKGNVAVTIPYTLDDNEQAGNVKAVYVDNNGKMQWLIDSFYNRDKKALHFSTNALSIYGIGYMPNDNNLEYYRSKDDVDFILNCGSIITTSTFFISPSNALNKIILFNTLGELSNSFNDVKQEK